MDCTFMTEEGFFNFRVGAVITDGRRVLMATNPHENREFYYSVGGRVRFNESLEEALLRELKEETGLCCEIDRLYAIHENFFFDGEGVPVHEISAYFLIKKNKELLSIENGHLTDKGPDDEYLIWIDLEHDTDKVIYPEFFRDLDLTDSCIKHYLTRD